MKQTQAEISGKDAADFEALRALLDQGQEGTD